MAIREWWIYYLPSGPLISPKQERIAKSIHEYHLDQEGLHVIDATGMPSKEEIRSVVHDLKVCEYTSHLSNTEKVLVWLEKLSEE